MKVGLRAHDYGKHTAKQLAKLIVADGFETVQLAIPKAIQGIEGFGDISQKHLEEIQESFQKNKVDIAVLGCYIEPSLGDSVLRKSQVDIYLQALKHGKFLGATMVGTETTHFAYPEGERAKYFEILVDSVKRMVDEAERLDIWVGIEPVKAHTLATPELTRELIERVDSDKLKIILDPVNMLGVNEMDQQEEVWKKCIRYFGDWVEVLHIKDVRVKNGVFVPTVLGEGCVDYREIAKWACKEKQHIGVLREELNPQYAQKDFNYLKNFVQAKL
ncbi:MAG: sugar phosphate isomerase/epimerase family protein [Lachnospiraceae bacterium]